MSLVRGVHEPRSRQECERVKPTPSDLSYARWKILDAVSFNVEPRGRAHEADRPRRPTCLPSAR